MYKCDTDARQIQAISSKPRQYGRQVKRYKTLSEINTDEADPGFDSKNQIDARAKTTCAVANWKLLSNSGQCWTYMYSKITSRALRKYPYKE